jgi:hypothetical protein
MKITKGVTLLAGLSLALAAAHAATAPVTLVDTTFAPDTIPWGYGYFYNTVRPDVAGDDTDYYDYFLAQDLGETPANTGFAYLFDTTGLQGNMDWGTGFGSPLVMSAEGNLAGGFGSGNRDDYTLTFRAKAAGLVEGQTADAEMQFSLYVGDNDPADKRLQVNIPFRASGDWQTYSFNLGQFALGGGTADANFASSHLEIRRARFNVNMHQAGEEFGYDANNALYLDDMKLNYVAPEGEPEVLVPQTIAEWDFDDKPFWGTWGPWAWSQKAIQPIFNKGANLPAGENTLGVEGSGAFWLSMNNFVLFDDMPAWAGGGAGGNGPSDVSHFTTDDLSKYRVTFDARVQGLNEFNGRTETTGKIQVFFMAPDDTVQPADDDTFDDGMAVFDFETPGITAEFKTFSFTFNRGALSGITREELATKMGIITGLNFQLQIENAADANAWDLDDNNFLIVDNVLIERLYPEGGDSGPGELTYAKEGNELVLTWTIPASGVTTLQSSELVDGEYTNVTTEGNTHRVALDGTERYFRLNWIGQ